MRIRDRGERDGRRDGAEGVEALGRGPGKTLALGFILDVARGEVDGGDVVGDYAVG